MEGGGEKKTLKEEKGEMGLSASRREKTLEKHTRETEAEDLMY